VAGERQQHPSADDPMDLIGDAVLALHLHPPESSTAPARVSTFQHIFFLQFQTLATSLYLPIVNGPPVLAKDCPQISAAK
jgi:hypothetical protein